MIVEGAVTNVTKFGAFVDIGVHQDGLVHISELSDRYVKEPGDDMKVGQIVKAQVLSVDAKAKRIALSMKALMKGSGARPPQKPQTKEEPKPAPSLENRLASLADRWKTR